MGLRAMTRKAELTEAQRVKMRVMAVRMAAGEVGNVGIPDFNRFVVAQFGGVDGLARAAHDLYEHTENDRVKMDILKTITRTMGMEYQAKRGRAEAVVDSMSDDDLELLIQSTSDKIGGDDLMQAAMAMLLENPDKPAEEASDAADAS